MADHKTIRCAIYTRKSSEYGLEQDFNSLDAQREACEAYIKSQTHEDWRTLSTRYDDGGISGATLERPAVQRLLTDVREGKVDVIVVYKVDRLTRSLADFAKLVEFFEAQNVSFVSVTQQFNTTTSMGRLTLNVLLSFAQFEREVTAEHIRDKVAASKKKGLWLGGVVPLGYAVRDKKLEIDEKEAEQVRMIFRRYLDLPSLKALKQDLDAKGVVTKTRALSSGKVIGGIPFYVGPLAVILKNRIYIGEIAHKGQIYPGRHQPIVDRICFEEVRAKLAASHAQQAAKHVESGSFLMGRIFDDAGNRMTPVHTRDGAKRYRYYVSTSRDGGIPASVSRVSAPCTEELVISALQERLSMNGAADGDLKPNQKDPGPQNLIENHVEKVIVSKQELTIVLTAGRNGASPDDTITLPRRAGGRTIHRQVIPAQGETPGRRKTLKSERRLTLLMNIAKARRWASELIDGRVNSTKELASREGCSERRVQLALSLAFLAPDIVKAAVDGLLPPDLVMTRIWSELPHAWSDQRKALALV